MLREVGAITAGVLGHHNEFLGAIGRQHPGLIQHVVQLAAAVLAPEIGNDTEGTAVVAALSDLDIGEVLRSGHHSPHLFLRGINGAEIHHAVAGKQLFDGGDNLGIAAGAQDTVHLGHLLQDIPLIALAQAAGDQDLAHLALCLQRGSGENVINGFALGGVNKAAGVDDHHIAAGKVREHRVSRLPDPVHHPLAVHLVLGTAKRNKSDICHS